MPQSCSPTTTHVPSTNNSTFKNQILKEVCLAHNVGGSNACCPHPCGWLCYVMAWHTTKALACAG